jgi:hypothetical protein
MGKVICGHIARGFDGGGFTCYRPAGHTGWHEESIRLRDGSTERTNWGDDGLGIHASGDEARRKSKKVAAMREP